MRRFLIVRRSVEVAVEFAREFDSFANLQNVTNTSEWSIFSDHEPAVASDGAFIFGDALIATRRGLDLDGRRIIAEDWPRPLQRRIPYLGTASLLRLPASRAGVEFTTDCNGNGEIVEFAFRGKTLAICNDYQLALVLFSEFIQPVSTYQWPPRMHRAFDALEGFRRLPAGSAVALTDHGAVVLGKWPTPAVADRARPIDLRSATIESVKQHLPPGRFSLLLSGGVDSGVLAASIAALGRASDCTAVSLRFPPPLDERDELVARAVARRCGIAQVVIECTPEGLCDERKAAMLGGFHPWNQWWSKLQRECSRLGDVAIAGVGGDSFRASNGHTGADFRTAFRNLKLAIALRRRADAAAIVRSSFSAQPSVGVDITSGDGTGYGYALSNVVLGTGVSVVHPLTTLSNRYAQTAIESGGAYEKSNLRFAFAYDLPDSWFRLGKQPTRIARLLGDDAATLQLRAVGRFVSDLSLKSTKFRLQNHHRHRPLSQP